MEVPHWPTGAFDADTLTPLLEHRLVSVIDKLAADNEGGGLPPWLIGIFAVPGVVKFVATKVIDEFKADLKAAGL